MRDRRFADPETSLLEPVTLVPIEQYRIPAKSPPVAHPAGGSRSSTPRRPAPIRNVASSSNSP